MSDNGYKAACLATGPVAYWRLGEEDYYYNAVRRSVPVSYWRLNEATPGTGACADDMGAYNGTYAGSPTGGVTGAITNDTNKAVTFNGSNSASASTALRLTGNHSLECWIYASSAPNGGILGWAAYGSGWQGSALYTHAAGQIGWLIGGNFVESATGLLTLNTWHHIVATWDGSAANIYIDGTIVVATGAANATAVGTFGIGANALGGYAGSMDEVAIYSRALTATEVAAHFAAKSGPAPSTNAADATGNGHTGTYVGSPTLGAAGLLAGDSDTAVTFTAAQSMAAAHVTTFDATNAFSVAQWVSDPTGLSSWSRLWTNEFNDGQAQGVRFHYANTGNYGWWFGRYRDGAGDELALESYASPHTHFVVCTYDGAYMRIYDNGQLVAGPMASSKSVKTGTQSFSLGTSGYAGTQDEPAIWDRALTAGEIAKLFAIGEQKHIAGVTRNSVGTALGSCVVESHLTADGSKIAVVTSDAGTGAFSVLAGSVAPHYLVAYKAGSPDIAGTSVNALVGS